LNVTHKTPYKRYEGKTNDLLIAFIGYVNDLNKLQQFKVSVQKSHHRLNALFNSAALLKQGREDDLRRATRTVVKRVEKCIEVDGGIFEHLLRAVAIY
jgi:short-subunit dehydrogenase involved in D-alanine esterification of teichoic acids